MAVTKLFNRCHINALTNNLSMSTAEGWTKAMAEAVKKSIFTVDPLLNEPKKKLSKEEEILENRKIYDQGIMQLKLVAANAGLKV